MSAPRATHSQNPSESSPHPVAGADASLLYTPAQAAALLQVRESWLRRNARTRTIPCTFLGRHLRFSPADLAAIVATATATTTDRRRTRCDSQR